MKLKNNRNVPITFHYSNEKGRKFVLIPANGTVEIEDSSKIVSNVEVDNKWIEVVNNDEVAIVDKKMIEAQKDVEDYMLATEKKKSKKTKNN